jgi:hypothetical protein
MLTSQIQKSLVAARHVIMRASSYRRLALRLDTNRERGTYSGKVRLGTVYSIGSSNALEEIHTSELLRRLDLRLGKASL